MATICVCFLVWECVECERLETLLIMEAPIVGIGVRWGRAREGFSQMYMIVNTIGVMVQTKANPSRCSGRWNPAGRIYAANMLTKPGWTYNMNTTESRVHESYIAVLPNQTTSVRPRVESEREPRPTRQVLQGAHDPR